MTTELNSKIVPHGIYGSIEIASSNFGKQFGERVCVMTTRLVLLGFGAYLCYKYFAHKREQKDY